MAYTQRELVPLLIATIDAARGKAGSTHRDLARQRLRDLLREEDWQTAFVTHNLGVRRLRWLASSMAPAAHRWVAKLQRENEGHLDTLMHRRGD